MNRKAVFLDRDGVINEVIFRVNDKPIAPWSFKEFKLCDGITEPLRELKNSGYLLFVVSNQPDISKGLVTSEVVERMNDIIVSQFPIEKVVFCSHEDIHNCSCRKPKPGMIIELAYEYEIDLNLSFMIGDNWKDINAGEAAGCSTVLIQKAYNKNVKADFYIQSLAEATDIINSMGVKSK